MIAAALVFLVAAEMRTGGQGLGVGRPPTADEARAATMTIFPDGRNLPPGEGTVADGARLYAARCQSCHGLNAEGGTAERLAGGQGTLASARPIKTVTSYWPYATTFFDYVRRAMPFNAPGTLSDSEVYALTAYVLSVDGVIPSDAVMNAQSLPQVRMPNRDGFIPDPRPGATGP
jgi:cytochrome c